MRQSVISIVIAGFVILLPGCETQTGPDSDNHVLVEGAWHGTLDSADLVVTFIEGEFEGAPTVSGSAYLSSTTQGRAFLIGSGTHNRVDSLWFSLFPIPAAGKESYFLRGSVRPGWIHGSFQRYDSSGQSVGSGSWEVGRAWERL
jgi:hypothetical protein